MSDQPFVWAFALALALIGAAINFWPDSDGDREAKAVLVCDADPTLKGCDVILAKVERKRQEESARETAANQAFIDSYLKGKLQ